MKQTSKMYIAVQWSLTPMVFTGMVETTTKRLTLMKRNNKVATLNARPNQNQKETSNVEVFEIDIMEELKFEHEECEESELSKLLLNL